ncbi:glycosyltransferase, partial [Ursidibacter sp. B-7004-1]
MKNKTICWNAIVKNESAIIERCMSSMVGQIDYWVVVDTGSTDGTQQIIKDFMQRHNIPGELIERPWKNFSHNRSEALEFAENKADYIFLCDADMTLEVIDPDWKEKLGDSPCYNVIQKNNFLRYSNIRLINGRLKGTDRFRYWGATHEYCDSIIGNASRTLFTGIELPDYTDGGAKADKYERDARLLSEELEFLYSLDDADNETIQFAISEGIWQRKDGLIQRCTFYLAQTWRDSEKLELALETYEKRVELNGWAEEVYYSLLQIAILKEKLAYEFDDVVNSYLRAYEYRPHRAESLYHLAKYLRLNDRIKLSYIYAYIAANTSMNDDILFVNYPIYEWKAKDELAVAAYWVGNYKLSYDLCLELLKKNKLDKDTRVRIASNMRFSEE